MRGEEQHFIYFDFIISKHDCGYLGLRFILFRKNFITKLLGGPSDT